MCFFVRVKMGKIIFFKLLIERQKFSHRISRFLPSRSRRPQVLGCGQKRRAITMAARTRTSQQRQACYLSAPRRELNCLAYVFVQFQLFEGASRSISGTKTFTVSFKNFFVLNLVSGASWRRGFHLNIQTFCHRLRVHLS